MREVEGDFPQPYLQGLMIDYYRANVSVTDDKIIELERATRGQSTSDNITNNIWMTEQRKRITSSTTGIVAKCRSTTKVAPLVNTLLYTTFRENVATTHGHDQEPATRTAYLQAKLVSSPSIVVQPSGLVIHPVYH